MTASWSRRRRPSGEADGLSFAETNNRMVAECRAASDAAEGIRLANGLREALTTCVARGEMREADLLLVCASGLDEIRERAGDDPRPHEAKAKRLRDQITRANTGLVVRVVEREIGHSNPDNFDEAVQEGYFGIFDGIERFDAERGAWSNFILSRIRYRVQECKKLQSDFARYKHANRMPPDIYHQIRRVKALHNREPEPHELIWKGQPVTWKQYTAWTHRPIVTSLDHRLKHILGREDSVEVEFEAECTPEAPADRSIFQRVEQELDKMSGRNADIVRAIFIEGCSEAEAAERFGLSDRRVRAIKRVATDRLRKALR